MNRADARNWGVGGWTLSNHHFYDPIGKVLLRGDGSRVRANEVSRLVTTVAGGDVIFQADPGNAGPARGLTLDNPSHPAFDSAGNLYFRSGGFIRKVDTAGFSTIFAGGGGGPSGNEVPAATASIDTPGDIVVGRDGTLYFSEPFAHQVRTITPDGILHHFFGGSDGVADGPAATRTCVFATGLWMRKDGSLLVSCPGGPVRAIYEVTTDGNARVVVQI